MGRIAARFTRVELRLCAGRLVLGLLSDLPRNYCWTIAEWAGEAGPYGMQHLLCRAAWDADAVRDDVREYVVEHLHDEAAALVVDETGDVKRDPTYTGRAMAGLIASARDGDIRPGEKTVFLHTGGLLELFGHQAALSHAEDILTVVPND